MGPIPALKIVFALLAAVLLVFNFAAPHKLARVVATVLAWGAVAFGNVPGLQVYVVKQAERFTPQAGGRGLGPEHRGLQPRHCRRGLGRRPDRHSTSA